MHNDFTSHDAGPETGDADQGVALSQRQREILKLLKAGKVNKEIATELDISVGTVKQHLVVLFKKLGVTNRAMAIAKSYAMEEEEADPEAADKWIRDPVSGKISILEKRPAAVLSLKLVLSGGMDRDIQVRDFYKTFAEIAFDFGAVFFSHNSGHCEMIFGVGRVRRHDVLRAVRAGVAIVEDLKNSWGRFPEIQGGLAFGPLVASTDKSGGWSGEAIAGLVISKAHDLAETAAKGMVQLDGLARQMIGFLGVDAGDGIPTSIPLTRDFHWRRSPLPMPTKLFGRTVEIEQLRSALLKTKFQAGGVGIIDSENGMGRSALLQAFAEVCLAEDCDVETWVCSRPDTQPGTASLGIMEKPGTDLTQSVDEFSAALKRRGDEDPGVILIDDFHLFPKETAVQLVELIDAFRERPLFVVLTGRGRMPVLDRLRDRAIGIHLAHLTPTEADVMISDLLGPDHRHCERVSTLAAGVPGFIVELVRPLLDPDLDEEEQNAVPLTLFSVITERIELIGLDRRFLHLVARRNEPVRVEDIRKSWPLDGHDLSGELEKALRVGVLYSQPGDRLPDEFVSFRHPIVRAVMAAAAAGKSDLFQ
jgi:DNA-binding CsgD family transcriptional regulator